MGKGRRKPSARQSSLAQAMFAQTTEESGTSDEIERRIIFIQECIRRNDFSFGGEASDESKESILRDVKLFPIDGWTTLIDYCIHFFSEKSVQFAIQLINHLRVPYISVNKPTEHLENHLHFLVHRYLCRNDDTGDAPRKIDPPDRSSVLNLAQLLIDSNLPVTKADDSGDTPLHYLASLYFQIPNNFEAHQQSDIRCDCGLLAILFLRSSNPYKIIDQRNKKGLYPLKTVIDSLISYKSLVSDRELTTMPEIKFLQILLRWKPDLSLIDSAGNSLFLQIIIYLHRNDIDCNLAFTLLKVLLESLDASDAITILDIRTPRDSKSANVLDIAAQCSYPEIVRLLIEHGAKLDAGQKHVHPVCAAIAQLREDMKDINVDIIKCEGTRKIITLLTTDTNMHDENHQVMVKFCRLKEAFPSLMQFVDELINTHSQQKITELNSKICKLCFQLEQAKQSFEADSLTLGAKCLRIQQSIELIRIELACLTGQPARAHEVKITKIEKRLKHQSSISNEADRNSKELMSETEAEAVGTPAVVSIVCQDSRGRDEEAESNARVDAADHARMLRLTRETTDSESDPEGGDQKKVTEAITLHREPRVLFGGGIVPKDAEDDTEPSSWC